LLSCTTAVGFPGLRGGYKNTRARGEGSKGSKAKANSEAKVVAMKNFLFLVLNIKRKGGNKEDSVGRKGSYFYGEGKI